MWDNSEVANRKIVQKKIQGSTRNKMPREIPHEKIRNKIEKAACWVFVAGIAACAPPSTYQRNKMLFPDCNSAYEADIVNTATFSLTYVIYTLALQIKVHTVQDKLA